MLRNVAILGRSPAPHSVRRYGTTLPTSFCSLSWDAPPSPSPSSSRTLSCHPVRAAVSRRPLCRVIHFVLSSPSSCRSLRLVAPAVPFVSSPLRRVTLRRPVCVALTAPFVVLPQCVALSVEVICGVFYFSFSFSANAPFFNRCIGDTLLLTDAR